jgi:uncharacterized protein (DUF433 family)
MSAITNEQLYIEIESLKDEIKQIQKTLNQFRVLRTDHPHITKIEGLQGGEPIVRESFVTVRTIVEQIRLGTSPDELVQGYSPLSLAEIYDALSYYYDHIEEIENLIHEHRQALDRAIDLLAHSRSNPPSSSE